MYFDDRKQQHRKQQCTLTTGNSNALMTGSSNALMTGNSNALMTGSSNALMTGSSNALMTGSSTRHNNALMASPTTAGSYTSTELLAGND